jgi:hypothetical protein
MKTLLLTAFLAACLNVIAKADQLVYPIIIEPYDAIDWRTGRDYDVERHNRINQAIEIDQRQQIINQLEQLNNPPVIIDHTAPGGRRR